MAPAWGWRWSSAFSKRTIRGWRLTASSAGAAPSHSSCRSPGRRPADMRRAALVLGSIVIVLGLAAYWQRASLHQQLFELTGEEGWLQQAHAVGQLAGDLIRPRLNLQPETPIAYNCVNPFGINTFLQLEVEPTKRQPQVELNSRPAFHSLPQ